MQGSDQRLEQRRVSGSRDLIPVLHSRQQELTGVSPHPGKTDGENHGCRFGLNVSMIRRPTQKIHYHPSWPS